MTVTPADLAETLRRRCRDEQAEWSRRGADLRRQLVSALEEMESPPDARMWLIGSLRHRTFGPHSDVDLVVEGLDSARERRLWSELSSRLEAPLDLLRFEDLPESFQERIREEGELLP